MDIEKLFKKIESLDDYINATQDVSKKYKTSKIQFNMSTVLSLKKARFLEIEYFNKCNRHGAAFVIFERILEFPGSKSWGLLGKELVALLQHWLDATRKHIIVLNSNWWSFLNMLLKFIKELRLKDSTLPDLLVEGTAEQLLDIATRTEPDVHQRQHILYCLNLCCADSSREVRFATRHRLESYFVKLSQLLATSGHAPVQYSMLESLLRWLLPRQSAAVRQAAAAKWFPDTMFRKEAVDIFLERLWLNFPQDARDFLNAHNRSKGLVTSVIYRRINIGSVTIDCSERRDAWLDINSASKSITVLLDGRTMQDLDLTGSTLQTLVINEDAVTEAEFVRVESNLILSIKTSCPVPVYPSEQTVGDGEDIVIVISSRNDLNRMDNALRGIFGDKYKMLIDLAELTVTSPRERNIKIVSSSEEDTRFSHPVRPTRRKASGYVIKSAAATWKSPSTTSTTSLALLHDRLEALPKFRFNKEPVKVSALPDLSIVSEITEINDSQSTASGTGRNRTYGLSFKSFRKSEKQSQSDGEKYKGSKKYISPIVRVKENDTSCLLVATIGSDESVINETIECLSKTKDCGRDNIVELLLQEALQSKDDKLDSGIQTGENKRPDLRDSDAIDNTPDTDQSKSWKNKKQNEVRDEKSEECNDIDGTRFEYVSTRKKVLIDKHNEIKDIQQGIDANDMHVFDQETVEHFFLQHISEDRTGGLVVSPTLARKINETSSECSDRANAKDIQNEEIIDCMNNIIDKVCHDFEKCAEILKKDNSAVDILKMAESKEGDLQEKATKRVLTNIGNVNLENKKAEKTPKKKTKQKKAIKLQFNTKKILNKTRNQKQKLEAARKMSPIPENKDSVEPVIVEDNNYQANDKTNIEEIEKSSEKLKEKENKLAEVTEVPVTENIMASPENLSPNSNDSNLPLIRRRRKLYSPKVDHDKADNQNENTRENSTEIPILQEDSTDFKPDSKKMPKTTATCYKDIEKERKKIRLPRNRKSKGKPQTRSPSPKTKKMNALFDNLKANVEKRDDIVLADKKSLERELAVYNFTSDSEDEDFKKKKFEIKKRISTTTNASGDSTTSRHGRPIHKVNYAEKYSDETTKKPRSKVRRKKVGQRRPHNLADEKMRDAQHEDLNTSFILDKNREAVKELDFNLEAPPQMEAIGGEIVESVKATPRPKRTVKNKKKVDAVIVKKEKGLKKQFFGDKNDNDDRTLSPLPGLVIEKVPLRKDDPNDSVSTQVMNKLKKIYHGCPDPLDESNTTQNLLLDVERIDFSQHLNITNELEKAACNVSNVTEKNIKVVKPKPKKNNAIFNDEENVIQIISFDEDYGKTNREKDYNIVNISDISEVQSEKSIATVGKSPITAHGDVEEDPPDNSQLNKRVQPRNLEIEDMDTSMKDYYLKLREEINKPVNSSTSNSGNLEIEMAEKTENRSQKCISPVVSVCKMSLNDIKKVLGANSDSSKDNVDLVKEISDNESNKFVSRDVRLNKISDDKEKSKPSKSKTFKPQIDLVDARSENVSRKSISPVVSLSKMSYDDISKWLPSRRNSNDSSAHSSERSVVIETVKFRNEEVFGKSKFLRPRPKESSSNMSTVSRKRTEEVSSPYKTSDKDTVKEIPNMSTVSRKRTEEVSSPYKTSDKDTVKEIPNSQKSITLHYDLRSAKCSSIKKIEMYTPDRNNNDQNSMRTRKTLISPIKLFDEPDDQMIQNQKSNEVISLVTDKESGTNRENDIKSPILNISATSKEKVYDLRKSVNISSCESRISSSTRVDGKASMRITLKRKSVSPAKEYGKKRKVEVLAESGPSMSSIDDWFKKSAPISAAKSLGASYGDSLQIVMEKLDTTLAEIHQNTSQNFVHMFVDAQRQLVSLRDERRRALKQVATEVLKEVVNVLDTKFADLEKRTQEIDTEFMEALKRRAGDFVREDCKKKRVMVTMLQDDIKAVLGHISKGTDSQ